MTPAPKFNIGQDVEVIETGEKGLITEILSSGTGIYFKPLSDKEAEEIEKPIIDRVTMRNGNIQIHPEVSLKAI